VQHEQWLGSTYLLLRETAEAISVVNAVLQAHPRSRAFTPSWESATHGRRSCGARRPRALAQLEPEQPSPHVHLATVYERQRQFTEAEAQLNEALRIAPGDAPARFARAARAFAAGPVYRSAGPARRTGAQLPGERTGYRGAGKIAMAQGRAADAIPCSSVLAH